MIILSRHTISLFIAIFSQHLSILSSASSVCPVRRDPVSWPTSSPSARCCWCSPPCRSPSCLWSRWSRWEFCTSVHPSWQRWSRGFKWGFCTSVHFLTWLTEICDHQYQKYFSVMEYNSRNNGLFLSTLKTKMHLIPRFPPQHHT